ncbi:MAG: MBL fold metallo-hydrolase [Acidimicrobiales bacterium]
MPSVADSPRRPESPPPRVEEVAKDVFAFVQPPGGWWVNNAGFVAGASEVLAVDTCSTERRTRMFMEAMERAAGRVARTLVNTHHHGDHTNGNCLLPYATVIGHTRCREEVLKAGIMRPAGLFEPVEWGALEPAPPFVTFEERLDVHVGDLMVELRHVGTAAHTTNDVFAWIPERRVLFTGDLLFNGGTPFVVMGSVAGSLLAIDKLLEYDAEVIVPGHGEPCTNEAFDITGRYLRFLQETAEKARTAGLSPLEAALEADLEGPGFAHLLEPERLVANLHRAYAECDGARPGSPIDLPAAFAEMVVVNGGRPLACLA